MDMIIFEVFLKNIHLIPQDQIVHNDIIYNINSAVVISVVELVVESSRCSSKHYKKDHVHMRLWTRLYGFVFQNFQCMLYIQPRKE